MKSKPWLPYVAPFAIYVLFLSAQTPQNLLWLYPGKTLAGGVGAVGVSEEVPRTAVTGSAPSSGPSPS